MKYLFWATLLFGLLAACSPAPEVATSVPIPRESPTIHPLYQEREGQERVEPRPTTTTFPSRIPEPTGAVPAMTEEPVATDATSQETVPAPSPTIAQVEAGNEREFCARSEDLADVLPVGYVLPGPWDEIEPSPSPLDRVLTNQRYINISLNITTVDSSLPALLTIFANHGILVDVFVPGNLAEGNAQAIAGLAAAGHQLGNSGYAIESIGDLSAEELQAEIEQANNIFLNIVGISTQPWFRPPQGLSTEASVQAAFEAGWTTVTWSGISDNLVGDTPDEIEDNICADLLAAALPGAILALGAYSAETPAAVDRFIRELHASGYIFLPLSILAAEDPASFIVTERP